MSFVKSEISKFNRSDFSIKDELREPAEIFIYWALPAIISVIFISWLGGHRTVDYYREAISQGIGPILWNVMACIGLIIFGFSVIFSKVRFLSVVASQVLKNVYIMGTLTFGLLLGQYICLVPEIHEQVEIWRFWLILPLSLYLLTAVFALNFAIWYLSFVVKWEGNFRSKLNQIHWSIRTISGVFISLLTLGLLWLEK